MKERNPLDSFNTGNNIGFKAPAHPDVCPTLSQGMSNPLQLIDWIGCHKILLIFIFAVIALLLYSGVKAKAATDSGAGGAKGGSTPGKK
jgi:hypothetical protein